jgi:hypothetical protein
MGKNLQTEIVKVNSRESVLEGYLQRACRVRGFDCIKLDPRTRKGIPDRMILYGYGRVVFCEVKTDRGLLSPMQMKMQEKMVNKGFKVKVVWSRQDVDDMLAVMEHECKSDA